jgi:RNA polymerase sigma-70 factor (ECF subfamily)
VIISVPMSTSAVPSSHAAEGNFVFATTHWSVVLHAGRSDTTRARDALEKLCQAYWFPIYAYVRRRGRSPHDAQDLTQEFFARLLEQNWVAKADPARGRFRSYLLGALNHFLAKEWRKGQAQKRGGGIRLEQLESAETRYGSEPVTDSTPEHQFERKWAVTLLDAVLQRLGAEFEREHKSNLFDLLRPCLIGERDAQPYAALSGALDMSEGAVKVAVHRLRRRYRQLLREEVAQTVESPDEVDDEMRHLLSVLTSH